MNNNYIFIDGKKYLLTEVKEKDNPFWVSKLPYGEFYFYVDTEDHVTVGKQVDHSFVDTRFNIANYFKDEDFAKQIALEQTLRRLLIRYACSCEVKPHDYVYYIRYDRIDKKYDVLADYQSPLNLFQVYFNTKKDAENAIEEVIKPFMKEHPSFKWR
jgi:hypothetical protein